MTRPHIVVGTPCFGGLVTQDYAMSLLNLQAAAPAAGFDVSVVMLGNDALITRGRSAIVAKFLDSTATHLLFIDADISFAPEQVTRLLKADKDFSAALYPAKIIDWQQMANRFGKTPETIDEAGLAYVGDVCKGSELKTDGDFVTGVYAGTGFQLIKRVVFERMKAAYPDTKYKALHAFPRPASPSDNLYALFDCMIDPETGVYLSEDYAFCRRWRAIGGEIWLDLKSRLNHTGNYVFRGNAAAHFADVKK
ncbi:MAG TPA: hypothetical protein VFR09_02315 [Alphaproteobacteria bacterium]|nr:hypothetical protein [Alphaproteobacteria bacterium]